jgi:beta-galactosidase
MDVRVYSNAPQVELLLNGKSLGRKAMPHNSHLAWKVNYEPGVLTARGLNEAGKEVAADTVRTTGAPAAVELVPDAARIKADSQSVAVVTVRVRDAAGQPVPVAGNAVSFSISGPGRIIGVGNGDPASHEPDKYFERVSTVPVVDWKTRATEARNAGAETDAGFDDSGWERARDPRWDEKREDPPASVFRGVFTLPAGAQQAAVTLVMRGMGETESIYVNGRALARDSHLDPAGQTYVLSGDAVHEGRNVVTVFATRFKEKGSQLFQWAGTGPAAIQVEVPAGEWKRSLFNGLAQVIVQSTGAGGEIRLSAASKGLAGTAVTIEAR